MSNIPKPPHGSPCNGCGKCCADQTCTLGRHVFGQDQGPCPALRYQINGQSECGLIVAPREFAPTRASIKGAQKLSDAAAILTGAGIGCDAQLEDEPGSHNFRKIMAIYRKKHEIRIQHALRTWGITR